MNILVSSCLLGLNCRYCGNGCCNPNVVNLGNRFRLVPVCPEQMGGLPTPRPPVELLNDKAATREGEDCTAQFRKGAQEVLKLAKMFDCKYAVLKSKSPSCGFGNIYDGTFSGKLTEGNGITANLLHQSGITILDENNAEKLLKATL